ncbi:hypothetical protein ACKWTF_004411 [Chironomus riparius]
MTSTFFDNYKSIIIGTGNILENEEFKKAKNPTQEMLLCMCARIKEINEQHIENGAEPADEFVAIPHEEITEEDETSEGKTKTVIKLFMNEFHEDAIDECFSHTLKICKTAPNVILAYTPTSSIHNDKFVWADNDAKAKKHFKTLWAKLREEKKAGRIEQLGIADMDLDTIMDIFDDKNFDFTILQINIVTCCMPPPCLVSFCKEHEIQLLTHSDPQVLFPSCHMCDIALGKSFKIKWVVRFLETLICRGILTRKGFIVNFQRMLD